jgi:signal transduction histidine kinase
MRLTFRAKLLTVVAISAAACALCVATEVVVANRVERQLDAIRAEHLPKIGLEPELTASFDALSRAFQDAVASRDLDDLSATDRIRQQIIAHLDAAHTAIDAQHAKALLQALAVYYDVAHDLSRRLIAGETGEGMVDAIAAMQTRRNEVTRLIAETASYDEQQLAAAFTSVARSESSAAAYDLGISLAAFALVLGLSVALSRDLLQSVASLVAGFERFGRGDFTRPIPVATRDEIADVAAHANEMAMNLDALARQRDAAEGALRLSNRELEAFSYSVAHDLRAPLRGINGFSRALIEDYGPSLDETAKAHLERIATSASRMGELIDALLSLARVARTEIRRERVDLTALARTVMKQLQSTQPDRAVSFVAAEGIVADGDPHLLRAVLDNLLGNAWKFTTRTNAPAIAFSAEPRDEGTVYLVRDNGAGFDEAHAGKLFVPFQRMHTTAQFPGTGIGLATVQRIVIRHGGRIWAESSVGHGATFFFTLGASADAPSRSGPPPASATAPGSGRGQNAAPRLT